MNILIIIILTASTDIYIPGDYSRFALGLGLGVGYK